MGKGSVKLVLDTCELRDRDFMMWLKKNYVGELSISAITYMEFRRQLINNKKDPQSIDHMLKEWNIHVIPFDKVCATISSNLMVDRPIVCDKCNKFDWTDTMIYSSIGNPPTLLVSENVTDFPTDGDRVYTCKRIKEKFGFNNR